MGDAKYLTDAEATALEEIKSKVSSMFPVREYIIFGSKARGDFGPDSDVDLLIIVERPLTYAQKRRITDVVFEVDLAHDVGFSYVCIDHSTWTSRMYANAPLRRSATREGVVV